MISPLAAGRYPVIALNSGTMMAVFYVLYGRLIWIHR